MILQVKQMNVHFRNIKSRPDNIYLLQKKGSDNF
jgi:hypothetical protein